MVNSWNLVCIVAGTWSTARRAFLMLTVSSICCVPWRYRGFFWIAEEKLLVDCLCLSASFACLSNSGFLGVFMALASNLI